MPWPALLALAVLLALGGFLGGCLEEAADEDFDFDNPNDTTPENGGDGEVSGVTIFYVDEVKDVVVVSNQGTLEEDVSGWTLENNGTGDQLVVFAFPSLTLAAGQSVRIVSGDGTDTGSTLHTGVADAIDWGNGDINSTAWLYNADGNFRSTCKIEDPCWPL